MIKGKKIETVNLKLTPSGKLGEKQVGYSVGREFVVQKMEFLKVKQAGIPEN